MREAFKTQFRFSEDIHKKLDGTFRGMASVFGALVDSWIPTIVDPGTFTKTLKGDFKRIRILYQHDDRRPIGLPISLQETDWGLDIEGKISDTADGRDALTLARDGVITDLSIGFDPIKWTMEALPGGSEVRHLQEVRLWEVSFVTWGANEPARISEVNALTECFDWLRLERVFTAESNTGALLRVLKPLFAGYEHKAGAELSETNRALIAEAVEALGKLTDDTTTTITSNAERDEMLRDALLQQAQDEAAQAA